MGQAFALVGATDPRLNIHGRTDLRLQRLFRAYEKADPPPDRVKPLPVKVLLHLMHSIYDDISASDDLRAAADMTTLGFFFLMRPGEYCWTNAECHPFRLMDVELWVGDTKLDLATATDPQLLSATFVMLTFSTQKNGVLGEKIGQGRSGHLLLCPVRATARRIIHLRTHGLTAPTTPLHTFCGTHRNSTSRVVRSALILEILRRSVLTLGPSLGLNIKHVTVCSLRASGAMALLCGRVDSNLIQLIGRWRSDSMLRYLHVQALPIMSQHAATMLHCGDFSFSPAAL